MKQKLVFLVGPTAVGKTAVAVELAKKLNAEIISCDSMQVYRKMEIISSKPPLSARKKVPHHLIDIIWPSQEYDVSKYRRAALKAIRDIIKKGKTPLLVGGTGLYMSILVDGIFEFKAKNARLRKKLFKEAEIKGSAFLHKKLQAVDPVAAAKIHPNDSKRIIRALEVFEATGRPISELQKQRKGLAENFDIKITCLNMDKAALNKRIDSRVERMFEKGLVKEAKQLLRSKLSRTAGFAIGIKELKQYFDGEIDLDTAKELIKKNTRLYAKRQLTWFRKDRRIKWIEVGEKEKPPETADRIHSQLIKNGVCSWKELS